MIKSQRSWGLHQRIIQKQFANKRKNNGLDREIPRERFLSLEERHKIIDELRLI